jgi:cell division protein FtsZ
VTVIAAGFDGGMPKRRDSGSALRREPARPSQAETRTAATEPMPSHSGSQHRTPQPVGSSGSPASRPTTGSPVNPSRLEPEPAGVSARSGGATSVAAAQQPARPRQVQFDEDDLDVPDFLK